MNLVSANEAPKRILIVDDEADITSTFATLLEMYGYESLCANNGKDALHLALKNQPHIIISDCMMPVMDGIELTKQIRLNPATEHIPVVLMSGAPHMHQLNEVAHSGFLLKPVKLTDLLSTIVTILEKNN